MSNLHFVGLSDENNVPLPPAVTLATFAAARIKEIQMMRKCMSEGTGSKLAFQKLPRHMRRRAMSHVVKRLPRRLRQIHLNQMNKSGLLPKSRRPTRKYRRRPLNLQSDYVRRQRRVKWLNTHIWHAKRFHMIEKWGYKLPKQPCDKAFRACYRATTKHCLIQDISYMKCVEIRGDYEIIIKTINQLADVGCGLSFAAKCYTNGKKFGKITLFKLANIDGFRQAIGDVQFIWNEWKNEKILCMIIHPSFYQILILTLKEIFRFELISKEEEIPTYKNCDNVVMRELENELNLFRLTGSLSTAVLKNALRLHNMNLPTWLENLEVLIEQNAAFHSLSQTDFLPPNLVLSLVVSDPRLNMPTIRKKAMLNCEQINDDSFNIFQQNLSSSPLFDDHVRNYVSKQKRSNEEISKMRGKCLVPGTELKIDDAFIPIILLWRPENRNRRRIGGYGKGWDILLPSKWAQSFFISFIMWGARAGGLRETDSIAFEQSKPDVIYPDTEAGQLDENYYTELYRDKYFRLPPNKRTNYNKFGISSPFSFNWKLLISEWSQRPCDNFSVLRNTKLLKIAQDFLSGSKNISIQEIPHNCLIPVTVRPDNKGKCSRYGLICLPEKGDFESEPVEPKHKDLNAAKRKVLRQDHKKLLKRLRKRRRRAAVAKKDDVPSTDPDLLSSYREQMQKYWLPEALSVKDSCSRCVIGFIKHGGFSFTSAHSKGVGYIAAKSLVRLQEASVKGKVLIRNPNTRRYKLAVLEIVNEF